MGCFVAIYRLLQQSAFDPDQVKRLSDAYEAALVELGLVDRSDPLTEIIAKHVIEIAQTGEKDPRLICELAITRLNDSDRASASESDPSTSGTRPASDAS